jgi:hypothetical protein
MAMSHKTEEELEFEQYYAANILAILDSVVVQVARERRAAEWAADIPAEWTANVEQRVREEMQAAGLLDDNE